MTRPLLSAADRVRNGYEVRPDPRTKRAQSPVRIISGGQTGVDRAALDIAIEYEIPCGGWCPRGRLAEDGVISARYPLKETPSADYAQRTEWNVRDSDATLILTRGKPTGGTALTIVLARQYGRPYRVIDLDSAPPVAVDGVWLEENDVRTLNVAGPRESTMPGIYTSATAHLRALLAAV